MSPAGRAPAVFQSKLTGIERCRSSSHERQDLRSIVHLSPAGRAPAVFHSKLTGIDRCRSSSHERQDLRSIVSFVTLGAGSLTFLFRARLEPNVAGLRPTGHRRNLVAVPRRRDPGVAVLYRQAATSPLAARLSFLLFGDVTSRNVSISTTRSELPG